MRYKTFRALVVSGATILAAGGGFLLSRACSRGEDRPAVAEPARPTSTPPPAAPSLPPPVQPAAAPLAPSAPGDPLALRPMDRDVLARVAQGISGDKVKDAFSGRSYKVNLYRDAGQSGVNRLKIDLDRDEKWDEKWDLKGDEVIRQVSPDDDDRYAEKYRLDRASSRWERL